MTGVSMGVVSGWSGWSQLIFVGMFASLSCPQMLALRGNGEWREWR